MEASTCPGFELTPVVQTIWSSTWRYPTTASPKSQSKVSVVPPVGLEGASTISPVIVAENLEVFVGCAMEVDGDAMIDVDAGDPAAAVFS